MSEKWWTVTKFDVGRELPHPDYVAQLEAENARLKRENERLGTRIETQDYFIADQNRLRNRLQFRLTEIRNHSEKGLAHLTEQE